MINSVHGILRSSFVRVDTGTSVRTSDVWDFLGTFNQGHGKSVSEPGQNWLVSGWFPVSLSEWIGTWTIIWGVDDSLTSETSSGNRVMNGMTCSRTSVGRTVPGLS